VSNWKRQILDGRQDRPADHRDPDKPVVGKDSSQGRMGVLDGSHSSTLQDSLTSTLRVQSYESVGLLMSSRVAKDMVDWIVHSTQDFLAVTLRNTSQIRILLGHGAVSKAGSEQKHALHHPDGKPQRKCHTVLSWQKRTVVWSLKMMRFGSDEFQMQVLQSFLWGMSVLLFQVRREA